MLLGAEVAHCQQEMQLQSSSRPLWVWGTQWGRPGQEKNQNMEKTPFSCTQLELVTKGQKVHAALSQLLPFLGREVWIMHSKALQGPLVWNKKSAKTFILGRGSWGGEGWSCCCCRHREY